MVGDGAEGAAALLNPNWANLRQKLEARRHRKSTNPSRGGKPGGTRSWQAQREAGPRACSNSSAPSVLEPTSEDFSLTEALAMDCEMVGVSTHGTKSALGRVTLVNTWGNVVYDEYVRPLEYVVDFRTKISGIRPSNLKKAKNFMTVQKKVAEFIKGRVLVGHALRNDLKVLLLSHPKKDIRDTAEYQPLLREGRRRSLKGLAFEILGVNIQQREHCPIEDARAAMLIYKRYKKEWESSIKKHAKFSKKLRNKHKNKSVYKQAAESNAPATS
ncbi:hypothetical protein HPP92_024582 [Vanilla planifolia]|uniref:RNA exonuclease 4 n=1 Tax=Vanilla planifolia TaxID=51239 RepID=A0A835UBN4_VANPL|nr:hypothetical protein HPP92_024582 [Vanilla planifolia]